MSSDFDTNIGNYTENYNNNDGIQLEGSLYVPSGISLDDNITIADEGTIENEDAGNDLLSDHGSIPAPVNKIMDFLALYPAETITDENGKDVKIFTHTSMANPPGSYNVNSICDMENVYKLLEHALSNNEKIHLTEKPTDPSIIKVDLDFRFDYEVSKRKYTVDHIKKMVRLYNDTILEFVDIEADDIIAYVFERPGPYKFKGNTKDGIHIMYPNVLIETAIQHMIRDKVLEKCQPILLDLELKNSITDVVDLSVIDRNNWLMYGCRKPGKEPYALTHVYSFDLKDDDLGKYSTGFLVRHLSNFNRNKPTYYIKDDPALITIYKDMKTKQEIKDKKRKVPIRRDLTKQNVLDKKYKNKCSDSTLQEAIKLASLLSQDRASKYQTWIEVGWCLHNIDLSLLSSWINFSKLSANHVDSVENECSNLWLNFREDGLGIGSLHRWAKIDNPDGYAKVIRESITNYILKSVTCTTNDVARVVYELYKYQFKCVSVRHNVWYEFRNHRWHEMDSAIGLKKRISNDVLNEYLHLVSYYNNNAIAKFDEHKDQYLVKSKALTDVTYKLRDITFKEKVLKECYTFFHDEHFFVKLDMNAYLIGFENGVYDLKKGEFRDGRPEDYISISTGNDYMEFEEDDAIIEEIYTFMSQIFTDKAVREYIFVLFSSFLLGQNVEQKFHIFTGIGSNGKSVLVEILELSCGEYCCKLPVTLLTQKRPASGSACPELARARAARFASLQEPDEHERLNIGYMKELTGGDKIMVRGLYKDPFEYKPKFKLVLCCNHLPKVPPNDVGTWRRLRVVEFLSKFKDFPNPNDPLEFQKDEYLSDKMYSWKEAFMYLLLQYFKKYKIEGIVEPDQVTRATHEYQKMCDIYIEFADDNLEKCPGEVIKIEETYMAFRTWHRENFDGKCPSRREFKDGITGKLGKYMAGRNAGWHGWRFLPTVDVDGDIGDVAEIEGDSGDIDDVQNASDELIKPKIILKPNKVNKEKEKEKEKETNNKLDADVEKSKPEKLKPIAPIPKKQK